MTKLNMHRSLTFVLLPLLSVAAPACGTSGPVAGTGGVTSSGGASVSSGGSSSGGAVTGSGGAVSSSGGASTSSGGAGTTSGGAAAGGAAVSGGAAATSGGGGTGTGGTAASGGGSASGGAGTGSGGGGNGGGTFHVFMLMGQSNMAGVAKREAGDNNSDERMKVFGGCGYTANQWNTVKAPPLSECPGEKGWNPSDSVDPAIWFAKTLLGKLPAGDTIGLVGTAESGESINTFITGGSHHNMILNKIAGAKKDPKAHFAGIIFHQGESDSGQSSWPGKVVQLYNEVKQAWGVDYDVPMILGELPAGGCCSGHNSLVHQAADQLPKGYWIPQDGTKVLDEYHFDHPSVVLMGTRYGEKMIEAFGW